MRYKDAGVNIDAADDAVSRMKKHARRTFNKNVLTSIGSFGAGFHLTGYSDPVLVSSADGVGTKLIVAFLTGRHDTVGEDLVNHCVNDIVVQGARPLFFLDYFAVGSLDAAIAEQVVSGVARGCKANACALIGGETAEMPGVYQAGEYDLAGFIVGVVERKQLLTGATIRPGDALLGIPSMGLHTNGYSLARKILFEQHQYTVDTYFDELGCTLGDELLKVHRSYAGALRKLMDAGLLKGAAHITGGGVTDNVPRILPPGLGVEVNTAAWKMPPIFSLLAALGHTPESDFRRTFNTGVGMVAVVPSRKLSEAERILANAGEGFFRMGKVIELPPRARKRVLYV